MSILSRLFGGHDEPQDDPTPYVPPTLDTDHIDGVQVRETRDKLPAECDECKRYGVNRCATHMAELQYTNQAARDAQGGRFRWYCDPHASQEVNRAQDAIRRRES